MFLRKALIARHFYGFQDRRSARDPTSKGLVRVASSDIWERLTAPGSEYLGDYALDPRSSTLQKKNADGYELFLSDLLLNHYGKDCSPCVRISFHQLEGKQICRITVDPASRPVLVPCRLRKAPTNRRTAPHRQRQLHSPPHDERSDRILQDTVESINEPAILGVLGHTLTIATTHRVSYVADLVCDLRCLALRESAAAAGLRDTPSCSSRNLKKRPMTW